VGDDVPVDTDALLVINFVNLKIKLAKSFGGTYRGRVCVHRSECLYVYKYLRLYCIFLKNIIISSNNNN
jgi:hypothetical protein